MRPTNTYQVHNYINGDETKAALWSKVPVHIWDVEFDELDPITFKDCYSDGHNASDNVASQWLLANFKSMCPVTIDSDVLVDKNNYEEEKWSRLTFEQDEEPVDASAVLAILKASGLDYYEPGEYDDCKWPCVDLVVGADALGISEVDALLKPAGWGTWACLDSSTWSVAPLDHDEDDNNDSEDGWHGILLNRVFLVDEERDAEVLDAAGFRILKHEDTGTVVAQVTFCGMSNEAYRARAGFLLAVERGWPILTEKGWRRPVR